MDSQSTQSGTVINHIVVRIKSITIADRQIIVVSEGAFSKSPKDWVYRVDDAEVYKRVVGLIEGLKEGRVYHIRTVKPQGSRTWIWESATLKA